MLVKAKVSFTYEGNILSMYAGEVADIDSTIAVDLIAEGFVEEYSGGEPTGTISISENGTYNVAPYASAEVSVSGGGGGSSDFSTAEVTLNIGNGITSLNINAGVEYPPDNQNSSDDYPYRASFAIGDTQSASPSTIDPEQKIDILTYQNEGRINWPIYCGKEGSYDTIASTAVSITGDAELITGGDYDYIKVIGDCELTITWSA